MNISALKCRVTYTIISPPSLTFQYGLFGEWKCPSRQKNPFINNLTRKAKEEGQTATRVEHDGVIQNRRTLVKADDQDHQTLL